MRLHSLLSRTLVLGLTLALCAPLSAPALSRPPAVQPLALLASPGISAMPMRLLQAPTPFAAVSKVGLPAAGYRPHIVDRPVSHPASPHPASVSARLAMIAPQVLAVTDSVVYSDGYSMWADGLVTNNGAGPVNNVTVTAVFLNSQGTELGRSDMVTGNQQFCTIDAGQAAPFTWAFPWWEAAPPDGTVSYRFEAKGDVVSDGAGAVLLPTQLVDMAVDVQTGWRTYTVQVTNDRANDVTATIVMGYERLAYGSTSFVDAMGSDDAYGRRLKPGESLEVEIQAFNAPYGTLAEPVFRAEARQPVLTPGLNTYETERTCPYGATMDVDGRIVDAQGADVASASIGVQTSVDQGKTWKTRAPVTSDATGRFAFALAPSRRTMCRFSSAGVADATVTLTQLAALSEPKVPAQAAGAQRFTVSGTLKPKHAARSKAVKLETRFVNEDYRQTAGPSFWAKATTYKSYSKYAGSVTLSKKGLWIVRAVVSGDSLHAATATDWHVIGIGVTTLSLKSSRSTVSYAKSAVLTATLRDVGKHGVKGRAIELYVSSPDNPSAAHWKTVHTNSAGVAKFSVKPMFGAVYGVKFAGNDANYEAASGSVTVKSSIQGGQGVGAAPTIRYGVDKVRVSAGLHQVILNDDSGRPAQFGFLNSAATKWWRSWTTTGAPKASGRFRLSRATTFHFAVKSYGNFTIYVW